ncbi:signal peptidase II [Bdellovibrionota bacterium FG-1]
MVTNKPGKVGPIIAGLLAVAADQLLKAWSAVHFVPNQSEPIFGLQWLHWARIPNPGLIWHGFASLDPGEIDPYIRYLPTVLLAGYLVTLYFFRGFGRSGLERWGLALLLAGGVSNLIDHWRSYYVTDTFKIRLGAVYQPFNLADLCIILGVFLIVLEIVRELRMASDRIACG